MTENKLTEKQLRYLDYIESKFPKITAKTYEDAKQYAGYAENTKTEVITESLKEEIVARTKRWLANYAPEAASKQIDLLQGKPNKWWRATLAITDSILDRVGVAEKQEEGNKMMPMGIIILPAKDEI